MYKRIFPLVAIGFSVLLALGLGTDLFLYQKLQQRVENATAQTLLLNQTRVRVRDAQVSYMLMAQQITDLLLDPASGPAFDERKRRKQQAREEAALHIGAAFAATQNMELKEMLRKLIDHNRQVILPLRDEILSLAATDLDAAKNIYWGKYLPSQAENMALVDEAIRLSSNELSNFNEKANEAAAQALYFSRLAMVLFACLGLGIAVFLGRAITHLEQELRTEATHDSLTGLYNRGAIIDILRKSVARHERNAFPLSIIFADLDHFKRTNDKYGHLAGDAVLREVARRVTDVLRPYDSSGRYGGEELLIVLPECGANDALVIAERVRSAIADQPVTTKFGAIPASLSLGVAMADGKSSLYFDDLIQLADKALYQAKENGRNRVVFANADLLT